MKRPMNLTDLRRRFPRDFVWGVATSAFQKPAAEIATPRYSFGKISDSSTHITGPSEIANEATKPMIAISTSGAFTVGATSASAGSWGATLKAQEIVSSDTAMPAMPMMSSGLRPRRSMSRIATTVITTLTRPTITAWRNASLTPPPACANIVGR